jgi:hypothetical protein
MKIYFSDYFEVSEEELENYGAFDISLVSDLPLFIDPFLLFNSKKEHYKKLHEEMIEYLVFLKEKSTDGSVSMGTLKAWYVFKEVEQNWFGFSMGSNKGHALGPDFGRALNKNLNKIFSEFGKEKITSGSHLEKLCLIKDGVGKDNISDFTTNLIKNYLLDYTEKFAKEHIDEKLRSNFRVQRVKFNYETEAWEDAEFNLPLYNNDFVILTPKELLTKDETWINKDDLIKGFEKIPPSISNEELRFKVNNYFQKCIPKNRKGKKGPTKKEKGSAAALTIKEFPELIDYYIKYKEANGGLAESISNKKVKFSEQFFVDNVKALASELEKLDFYLPSENSFQEAIKKILILKDYIENKDGYKLFYYKGQRIKGEKDLQLLFGLVCQGSKFDFNREPNNGRGPVDFSTSMGSADKTLIEFKLASSTKIEKNLQNQVEIYQKANNTKLSFKVIIYFSQEEKERIDKILKKIGLDNNEHVILINAKSDDKISASNV